jgi:Putative zinc-finger
VTDDRDLDQLLGRLAEVGRGRPDPAEHPNDGTLSFYHARKLSPEEEDQVREHLVECKRCRDLLLEYAEFVEDDEEERVPAGVADFRAAAERKKAGKGLALKWAAGILLGLVGLSVYLVSRPEAPLGKEDTTTLSARGSLKSRGDQDKAFKLPERLLLENPTPDTYPRYRVEILDGRGRTAQVFEGLQEVDYKIEVLLAGDSLPPGDYEAELSTLENGAPRHLGSFGFRVLPAD